QRQRIFHCERGAGAAMTDAQGRLRRLDHIRCEPSNMAAVPPRGLPGPAPLCAIFVRLVDVITGDWHGVDLLGELHLENAEAGQPESDLAKLEVKLPHAAEAF